MTIVLPGKGLVIAYRHVLGLVTVMGVEALLCMPFSFSFPPLFFLASLLLYVPHVCPFVLVYRAYILYVLMTHER
jgi:hypothetical protein